MNELDINNPQLPDFIVPGADEKKQDEPAKIKVIGVGGGGGNAVNHMYHQGIGGVSFVLCNTDAQALRNSPVPVKVQLGAKGEGAGNIPEVAKKLAEESAAEVEEQTFYRWNHSDASFPADWINCRQMCSCRRFIYRNMRFMTVSSKRK